MGVKTRKRAEIRKEEKKTRYYARLNNCPTSPRKMRRVADLVRGQKVELALHTLKSAPQAPAVRLHKLLLSAIANWQTKNEGVRIEESGLFVKEIFVDGGRQLKRMRTSPHGRAARIRKRSNHVTLVVDSLVKPEAEETPAIEEAKPKKEKKEPKARKETKEKKEK
ncbi:MAG TPA: 50S ribosomal protein L22 [Bacteroidales bacterium]|nr:50S ribosomal protein L22 [Bacteroidales bacterium]